MQRTRGTTPLWERPQADQAFRLGWFFVLFFRLVPSLAGLRERESYHHRDAGQEYFAECRKQSLKPHKSVVDWIAACHLGICKILDGDPFSTVSYTHLTLPTICSV